MKICSHLDQRGLSTICHVSRLLHDIAEPFLYRNVRIVDGRGKSFMEATKHRPQLASYIETVTVHYENTDDSGCALAPSLETCHNLQEFHLKSGFWHWNDGDVEWEDEQQRLCQMFKKNSLLTEECRILPRLEACKYSIPDCSM